MKICLLLHCFGILPIRYQVLRKTQQNRFALWFSQRSSYCTLRMPGQGIRWDSVDSSSNFITASRHYILSIRVLQVPEIRLVRESRVRPVVERERLTGTQTWDCGKKFSLQADTLQVFIFIHDLSVQTFIGLCQSHYFLRLNNLHHQMNLRQCFYIVGCKFTSSFASSLFCFHLIIPSTTTRKHPINIKLTLAYITLMPLSLLD